MICSGQILRASKWGQQMGPDQNSGRPCAQSVQHSCEICSDPFCVVCGALGPPSRFCLKSHSPRPRGSRQSVCHGHAGRCDALGCLVDWRAVLTACMYPQTPGCPCRHLQRHFRALHIQELLPHYSIGLQIDWYLKKASKPCFSALFLGPKAVGEPARTTKLCEFVYLAIM